MNHLNITQVCAHCSRGQKVFIVNLDLYDDQGRLPIGIHRSTHFEFTCHFCLKKTSLDFYRFSHPDVIMHLKQLKQHLNEMKQLLHKFNILFNNMNNFNLL